MTAGIGVLALFQFPFCSMIGAIQGSVWQTEVVGRVDRHGSVLSLKELEALVVSETIGCYVHIRVS